MMLHLAKLRFPEVESLARTSHTLVILPVGGWIYMQLKLTQKRLRLILKKRAIP
jgi:hypothetical protein